MRYEAKVAELREGQALIAPLTAPVDIVDEETGEVVGAATRVWSEGTAIMIEGELDRTKLAELGLDAGFEVRPEHFSLLIGTAGTELVAEGAHPGQPHRFEFADDTRCRCGLIDVGVVPPLKESGGDS